MAIDLGLLCIEQGIHFILMFNKSILKNSFLGNNRIEIKFDNSVELGPPRALQFTCISKEGMLATDPKSLSVRFSFICARKYKFYKVPLLLIIEGN